jgi:hypothetical protein
MAFLVVVIQAVGVTRADAWFGFFDELSGPGGWFGALLDLRLICFGPQSTATRIIQFDTSTIVSPDTFRAALTELDSILDELERTPALSQTDQVDGTRTLAEDIRLARTGTQRLRSSGYPTEREAQNRAAAEVSEVLEPLRKYVPPLTAYSYSVAATGVTAFLCPADRQTRRASIDFGVNLWITKNAPRRFADGDHIWFLSFIPAFAVRVADKPFQLDLGSAAGLSLFFSDRLKPFHEPVLEPLRVYVRSPGRWVNSTDGWRRVVAKFTGRVTLFVFPEGFEENAFAAVGQRTERISPELKVNYGIYYNIRRAPTP